jgi:putative transposase
MTLWRTYYHLVWSTRDRLPIILPNYEVELYSYIRGKSHSLQCTLHAIDGMPDHLHLIVSIPPSLAIAQFIKLIKGSSSHFINRTFLGKEFTFAWQREYGVFSLGSQQLERAVSYVNNQKQHHADGTIVKLLEPESLDFDLS